MRKGITATSAAIIIVIIFILMGTVTVTSYTSIQNAKKLVFAIEISEIQEEVTKYYKDSVDNTYPVTLNEHSINLSGLTTEVSGQFVNEQIDENSNIKVYEVDLALIGITDTKYGNKENVNDVYVLSKETGKVYYLEGIKASSTTYYTLTQDLIDIKDRNEIEGTSYEKPFISTDGIIEKTLSSGIKEKYISNIEVSGTDIKIIKYEIGIIEEENAKAYFKNNGVSIKGDRIKLQDEKSITIYAENIRGDFTVKHIYNN